MAGNPEKLRRDIDSGKTGDKVPAPDPAMAPLGTDEEAGGRPVSPAAVEAARRQEIHRAGHAGEESHATWLAVAGVAAVLGTAILAAIGLH